jgi:hypothetical protein
MTSNLSFSFAPWLVAAALAVPSLAQDPSTPAAPAPTPPEASASKSVAQWLQDLGSDSYRLRLDAERALRGLGKAALPELQKAAEASKDAEVQWRARRLVRQIEGGGEAGLQQRGDARDEAPARPLLRRALGVPEAPMPQDLQERFDAMFRRMEQDFGLDIPRGRFFQDDFFRGLEQQFQEQRDAARSGGHGQSLSMQIGPDGKVRVEVRKTDEHGAADQQVYEAPDLETFHRQYPGVLPQGGLGGGGLRWFFQGGTGQPQGGQAGPLGGRLPRLWAPRDGRDPAAPQPNEAAEPKGRRLGVFVRNEIPAELREYLDLEVGQGLMVESVQERSLAMALGLRQGDIVLELAGQSIGSSEDVQRALAGLAEGAEVVGTVLRKGQREVVKAKLPPAEAAAEPHDGEAGRDGQGGAGDRRGKRLERRPGKGAAGEPGGR